MFLNWSFIWPRFWFLLLTVQGLWLYLLCGVSRYFVFAVQSPSLTLCYPVDCSMPDLPVPHHLLEFAQVHVHCIIDAVQPSYPLLLLPLIFPSIRDFSNELSVCIRWPKYWSFNFSISPSNEYSGLISLKIDWFGLLADQGTLRSLL